MSCERCFDFRADPEFDGHCSAWCRDKADLERVGVTALSHTRHTPSRDLSAQVAAIVSGELALDDVIIGDPE